MRDVSARMIGGVDFRPRVWQTGWLGGGDVRRVSMAYFAITGISRSGELGMWKW